MQALIASPIGFIALLSFFAAGAACALLLRKNDELANISSGFFAIAGSLWGVIFAISALALPHTILLTADVSPFPLLTISFAINKLSAFFIFVISLITLFCSVYGVGYIKHFYKKYDIGALGFFTHLFIAGMILVVSASNGILFLIAWEVMSLASYFLVIYDRRDESNLKAGFLYLIMTHVGTAFILLSFLLLYKFTGSFDFATMKSGVALIPPLMKNAVFVLALIGFGTKAGIIPVHIWLPSAHPAAPSHVSALMSGVMIKTGIYMMIKIFLDMLQPIPTWWGVTVLIVGAVSSLLGVLYALTEHDIKRLLAYHSIENIGIILLGLGSALTFSSLGMETLALLGLTAALFHTLNHATFKSLLFLSAGSVISQTHTRNMEEYGGLIRYMPGTALFFLVGSMAISALPPFNGFFSEWLTFQSLFQGVSSLDFSLKWVFMLSAGALAFTGGLALLCFVKAFGITFLARPRRTEHTLLKESSLSLRVGMGALAGLSLAFGIFSGHVTSVLQQVGRDLGIFHYSNAPSFASATLSQRLTVENNFSSVSGPALFAVLIAAIFLTVLITKYAVRKNQKIRIGATWDCGTDLTPRMEITSTGFARSIVTIFRGILRPSIQHEIEYHDAKSRYLVKSEAVTLGIDDVYQSYLYQPLQKVVSSLSRRASGIQSGNVNAYLLYIFIALLVALFFTL